MAKYVIAVISRGNCKLHSLQLPLLIMVKFMRIRHFSSFAIDYRPCLLARTRKEYVPMLNQTSYAQGIEIHGPITPEYAEILTPKAMSFVATLSRAFSSRREELLQHRARRQAEIDTGTMPAFLPETAHIREGDWTVAPLPQDLQDRRVEITGPVERKMIINALNSGAKVFMADFEDSLSPTWEATIEGQLNL